MIFNESLKLSFITSASTFMLVFTLQSETLPSMNNWKAEIEIASQTFPQVKKHQKMDLIADQGDEFDQGYPYSDIPKNIGTDDIEGSELYKSNNLYDPNAGYYETNQGFDETPDYSIPQGE